VIVLFYLGYCWWTAVPKTGWNYQTRKTVETVIDRVVKSAPERSEPLKVAIFKPIWNDSEKEEALGYFIKSVTNSRQFSLLPQQAEVAELDKVNGLEDKFVEVVKDFFRSEKEKVFSEIQGFDGYLQLDLYPPLEDEEEVVVSAKLRYIPVKGGMEKAEIIGKLAKETYVKSFTNMDYLSHSIQETSWFGRLFIWLLIALAVPWASYRFSMRVLALKSNRANAILIGGLTLVSFVTGFILMGLTFGGFIGFIGLLLMTGLAGFWTTAVLLHFEENKKWK
jgi:hypothetical protein